MRYRRPATRRRAAACSMAAGGCSAKSGNGRPPTVYSAYEAVDACEVDYDSVAQTCPPCVPMRYFKVLQRRGRVFMTTSIAVWSVWCKSCRAAPHHLLEYFLRVAYSHLDQSFRALCAVVPLLLPGLRSVRRILEVGVGNRGGLITPPFPYASHHQRLAPAHPAGGGAPAA